MNEFEDLKENDRRYRKNTMIYFYRISDALLWHLDAGNTEIIRFRPKFIEFSERVEQHYKLSELDMKMVSSMYDTIHEIVSTNHIRIEESTNPLNVFFDKISNILQEADTDFFD